MFGRESQIRRSPWKKTQETVQEEEAAQAKETVLPDSFIYEYI